MSMTTLVRNPASGPRFKLGRILATPAAMAKFDAAVRERCLRRHLRGDWGDLEEEDRAKNEAALVPDAEGQHDRLFSSYDQGDAGKLWIITEADRSVTTLLLPEDY